VYFAGLNGSPCAHFVRRNNVLQPDCVDVSLFTLHSGTATCVLYQIIAYCGIVLLQCCEFKDARKVVQNQLSVVRLGVPVFVGCTRCNIATVLRWG